MQTSLHFHEFDAVCVNGPLSGQLYAIADRERPQLLGIAQVPYRPIQSDSGEWVYLYADELDSVDWTPWERSTF